MLTIFLSDLHIGINAPANWYQKDFHQRYLKAILRYIQANGAQIQDVVILGDWLEYWVYLPEGPMPIRLQEIFDANPEIFTPVQDGDFITCMDSIRGELCFVNGNHDMTVTSRDINRHFRPLSQKGKQVVCTGTPQENVKYEKGGIYAGHGHEFSLFCRPDNNRRNKYKPLPIGYYISRTWSSIRKQLQQIEEKHRTVLLANCGNSLLGLESISWGDILESKARKVMLAPVVLFPLVVIAAKGKEPPEQYLYMMQDGSTINAAKAAEMFPSLTLGKRNLRSLMVDINNSLTTEGERLCKQGHKVVVLGHTHSCKMKFIFYRKHARIYANTGCLCASKSDLENNGGRLTFAEVEQKNRKYYVRLKKVDYPDTTISTFKEYSVDI